MSESIFFALGILFGGLSTWLLMTIDASDWGEPEQDEHAATPGTTDGLPDFLTNRDDMPSILKRQAE